MRGFAHKAGWKSPEWLQMRGGTRDLPFPRFILPYLFRPHAFFPSLFLQSPPSFLHISSSSNDLCPKLCGCSLVLMRSSSSGYHPLRRNTKLMHLLTHEQGCLETRFKSSICHRTMASAAEKELKPLLSRAAQHLMVLLNREGVWCEGEESRTDKVFTHIACNPAAAGRAAAVESGTLPTAGCCQRADSGVGGNPVRQETAWPEKALTAYQSGAAKRKIWKRAVLRANLTKSAAARSKTGYE